MKVCRRDCVIIPFLASMRMTARSLLLALVTKLRVYCS